MIEAPSWFVLTFDLLLLGGVSIGAWLLKAWINTKKFHGKNMRKMYAEITEPSGLRVKHLVEPDPTGATVTVNKIVYALPKELTKEKLTELTQKGSDVTPDREWIEVPNFPLPPIPVRIESWNYDNPEPKRAFYGRVDEKGMFIDSQLTVTATEWAAQKSVMQASQLAMRIQALETVINQIQKLFTSIPNKTILYLLAGLGAVGSVIAVILIYQMAGQG